MEFVYDRDGNVDSWEAVMFLYKSALKKMTLNMQILNDEFEYVHQYNPIEHIKSRLKEPESIVKKLKRHGYDSTLENMVKYVKDIAGVRIICSFTPDIYRLADMISRQNYLKVLEVKDYIKNPKPSGYTSYHMIVSVPVNIEDRVEDVKVEIQIRTVAMDSGPVWSTRSSTNMRDRKARRSILAGICGTVPELWQSWTNVCGS